jgi:tungstate transport system substrate-binding protein
LERRERWETSSELFSGAPHLAREHKGVEAMNNLEVKRVKKILMLLFAVVTLLSLVSVLPACGNSVAALKPEARLTVATTTSLYDTGLWGYLEPKFEQKYNVKLNIISVGSGKAFQLGKSGDVDVLTVHEPKAEHDFLAGNYSSARVPFAYNYFVIVGPPSDPAGIKGMNPVDAFKELMAAGNVTGSQVKFVSRGDGSGTQNKEIAIWAAAGYQYADVEKSGSWYIEAGAGMGQTLLMTNEKQAYTLTDIGTFVTYKSKLNLVPLVDQGDILLNVYSVMVVNSTKNKDMANNLVTFLTSPEIQDLIGKYGVAEYGLQLFTPCAGQDL